MKDRMRGWILSFIHNNEHWIPVWLHMYMLHDLPFNLSIIDRKSPLTDEDIEIIEQLVRKHGEFPK